MAKNTVKIVETSSKVGFLGIKLLYRVFFQVKIMKN